jgi:glycosyltransferase involved in cell wall biosynthesis
MLVEMNPSGGLFQFAFQLGRALAERGHDVELVTGPRPELASDHPHFRVSAVLPTWHASEGAGDARVKRSVRRIGRAIRYHLAWLTVIRRIAVARPDVVQFAGGRFPVDGLAMAWLARRRRRPLLVNVAHAPVPFNEQRSTGAVFKRNRLLDRSLDLGYRSLDAIMVLGEQTEADMRAARPQVERIHVIPHGDEGVFLDGPPTAAGTTGPVVLFFGTMQAYKGLDVLLDAFRTVRQGCAGARLVIAGAPSGDTDLAELRRSAGEIGGVEIRAGYVPLPEVAELFQAARVVAAPYRYANASGVVELSRTFARPVVATAVGDLPAVVEHGVSGLVVPPEDAAALADGLLRLLNDPTEAQRMGEAGRARSVEGASWATVAQRVEDVYAHRLGRRTADRDAVTAL